MMFGIMESLSILSYTTAKKQKLSARLGVCVCLVWVGGGFLLLLRLRHLGNIVAPITDVQGCLVRFIESFRGCMIHVSLQEL